MRVDADPVRLAKHGRNAVETAPWRRYGQRVPEDRALRIKGSALASLVVLAKASGEISIKCGRNSAEYEAVLLSHANNTLFDVYYLVTGQYRQAFS